ncbi:MAG: hypothetical protein V3T70_06065 [Phycisphaerae bacterium]
MYGEIIKQVVNAIGLDTKERTDAARVLLLDLITKRNDTYAVLWELVGDICPPKLMAGALHRADGIARSQMYEIANGIDKWYRKSGAILDSVSRYWLIALREECFSWLSRNRGADAFFHWHCDTSKDSPDKPFKTALRVWLIKTALRISIHRNVVSTVVSDERVRGNDWMTINQMEILPNLLRNYRVVYRAWHRHKKLSLPGLDEVADEVAELIGNENSQ